MGAVQRGKSVRLVGGVPCVSHGEAKKYLCLVTRQGPSTASILDPCACLLRTVDCCGSASGFLVQGSLLGLQKIYLKLSARYTPTKWE
jgi:hypothetical protein